MIAMKQVRKLDGDKEGQAYGTVRIGNRTDLKVDPSSGKHT